MSGMVRESAIEILRRETRVSKGPVPTMLGGIVVEPDCYRFAGDAYLSHTECGMRILYRKGEGLTVEWGAQTDLLNERLYLNGMAYAAVACMNGLYPIHASAVAWNNQIHAFTGPSGAGKSTLIAELSRQGLPLFCDDTLILDLREEGQILALPGHKQLKLWPDALTLTGAEALGEVWQDAGKFYAVPIGGTETRVLPLAELCFLEFGAPAEIADVSGAQRMMRLQDDHYTSDFLLQATAPDKRERFAQLARLARAIRVTSFTRPCDPGRVQADAKAVAEHIRNFGKNTR